MSWQTLWLIAENGNGKEQPAPFGGLGFLVPMLIIMALFFLFFILPQRRREKQMREQLAALKKNDRVITHGGIIGVVSHIDEADQEVILRVEEGKIRILKTAIARILSAEESQEAK